MLVRTWASVASLAMIGIIFAPSVPAQGATTAEPAWKDALVRATNPSSNYGLQRVARVTPRTRAYYAAFNTQIAAGATATGLRLCLTPTTSAPGRVQVYGVPDDPYAWNESGLTWNTQPSPGVLLATAAVDTVSGVRQCVELPVSARSATDTVVRVVSTSGEIALATAESRNASNRPTLAVAYDTDAPASPPVGSSLFTADGPWNAAIPANPILDPNNTAQVNNLSSGTHPGIANLYDFGTPVYEADATTRKYAIDCRPPASDWGTCLLETERGGVPIPDGAVANLGSDGAMTVIDWARGRGYCFWQYNNNRATTSWGGVFDIDGTGGGSNSMCTGSGLASVAGVVRLSEIRAGVIPHALVFSTKYCQGPYGGNNFRYPASKTDGKFFGTGALPEGARIQLDPSINVNAIPGITEGEKMVARALQTYGAYNADCGGANMGFTFETPMGGRNPYPSVGFGWDYFGMDRIPWHRLRVLRTWNGR